MSADNVKSVSTIDLNAKRLQLQDVWSRTLALCSRLLDGIEAGEAKVNASMIRELTGFIKSSVGVLEELEKMNRKHPVNLPEKPEFDPEFSRPLHTGELITDHDLTHSVRDEVPFPVKRDSANANSTRDF